MLFSQSAYQAVAEAYLGGLEARVAKGEAIDRIASVASFFVSRIDTVIDGRIDARVEGGDTEAGALKALRGKVAIANAKLAYAWYEEDGRGRPMAWVGGKGRDAVSGCCGPPPGSRTRIIPTRCTWTG